MHMPITNRLDNNELTHSFPVHFIIQIPKVIVSNLSIHPFSYTHYTMHIISYATIAQSQFPYTSYRVYVLPRNLKHKIMRSKHATEITYLKGCNFSPETLFIHRISVYFKSLHSQAMQDHLSNILNHIYQQKFYFPKFYFIFFKILSYFV